MKINADTDSMCCVALQHSEAEDRRQKIHILDLAQYVSNCVTLGMSFTIRSPHFLICKTGYVICLPQHMQKPVRHCLVFRKHAEMLA